MKKILLLFAIGYSLVAISPPPASAQSPCTPARGVCPDLTCQPPGFGQGAWCCPNTPDGNSACTNIQGGQPATGAPAAGAATPTCGADNSGTPTALGCIPNQPAAAIAKILPWAIRLGTGLAFLLFLYGAFTLITAGSDPQKVDTGKSIITSAAAGLIFIILSVILLRVIGIDILKL